MPFFQKNERVTYSDDRTLSDGTVIEVVPHVFYTYKVRWDDDPTTEDADLDLYNQGQLESQLPPADWRAD